MNFWQYWTNRQRREVGDNGSSFGDSLARNLRTPYGWWNFLPNNETGNINIYFFYLLCVALLILNFLASLGGVPKFKDENMLFLQMTDNPARLSRAKGLILLTLACGIFSPSVNFNSIEMHAAETCFYGIEVLFCQRMRLLPIHAFTANRCVKWIELYALISTLALGELVVISGVGLLCWRTFIWLRTGSYRCGEYSLYCNSLLPKLSVVCV